MWLNFFKCAPFGALRRTLVDRTTWLPTISLVAVWLAAATLSWFYSADTAPQSAAENAPLFSSATRSDEAHASELAEATWLRSGRTSSLNMRGSIVASVAGPLDRSLRDGQQLFFSFDWTADSVIESNDGKQIVELRTFKQVAEAFLIGDYDTSNVQFEDDQPSLFSAFTGKQKHVGMRRVPVTWWNDALASEDRNPKRSASRGFWDVASLSGKSIRLTHRVGAGVESIQPVNCKISPREKHWLNRATLDWHWGLPPGGSSAPQTITTNLAFTDLMPTTIRTIPPWSNLSVSDQAALSDSSIEHCAVKLSWTEERDVFKRWFPPGHLLYTDYKLVGAASVSLRIQRSQHESSSILTLPETSGRDELASVASPMSAAPPLAAEESLILPSFLQRHCYVLTFEGSDLGVALFFLVAVSTALFAGGARVHCWKLRRSQLALTASGLLLAIVIFLHGQASLSNILPLSSAIVLANWLPVGAAMLAGLLYGANDTPRWRREIFAFGLLGIGWYAVLCTVSPVASHSTNQFANGVCLQTSQATCSAAAAVSLLDAYNIRSDEAELARMCLTSDRGTNMLGIYRGLKLKTHGSPYCVVHVRCEFDKIQNSSLWPMLLPVKQQVLNPLTYNAANRTGVLDISDWVKLPFLKNLMHADHCVVLYGVTPSGDAIIGDPSNSVYGRVRWSKEQLRKSWLGEGFRLVLPNDQPLET